MAQPTAMQAIEFAVLHPQPGQRFNIEVWDEKAKEDYPEFNLHIKTKYAKYSI
jgi:hypothetical protein